MTYYTMRTLLILGLVLGLFFLISLITLVVNGFNDQLQKSDVAIILGSKVNPNGTLSNRLAARLNKGIDLYQEGIVHHVIVSGGTGKEGIDEAIAMKNYLVTHHIPADNIFTDSHGNNTAATAINSAAIMHAYDFKSALVISQYFHIARSRLALKQCGISPIYTAHANYIEWRDIYAASREVLGFYDYLLIHHACG